MTTSTFYDILEVDRNADAGAIRKAYLKASLKHHPDKNPDNVEAAKAKFVQIGQAYETLSDPQKRAIYDRELKNHGRSSGGSTGAGAAGFSNFADTMFNNNNNNNSREDQDRCYENYRDAFDATVAGMSEAELAAAMGAATAVASVVGSIMASRMMSHGNRTRGGGGGGGNSMLAAAGSAVGSMVASEMAASSVRALHQQSIQRLAYKEECRRCVERGEPIPDPPKAGKVEEIFHKAVDTFKGMAQNENTRSSLGSLWQGVKQAAAAANANNSTTAAAGNGARASYHR